MLSKINTNRVALGFILIIGLMGAALGWSTTRLVLFVAFSFVILQPNSLKSIIWPVGFLATILLVSTVFGKSDTSEQLGQIYYFLLAYILYRLLFVRDDA